MTQSVTLTLSNNEGEGSRIEILRFAQNDICVHLRVSAVTKKELIWVYIGIRQGHWRES